MVASTAMRAARRLGVLCVGALLALACGSEERAAERPVSAESAVLSEPETDQPGPNEPEVDEPAPPEPLTDVEPWLGGVPPYPGARYLCYQHVSGGTMHIMWQGYATPDPIERVRAFYEANPGPATLEPTPTEAFSLRIDAQRVISVAPAGTGHPTCDVAHADSDRTYFAASQSTE